MTQNETVPRKIRSIWPPLVLMLAAIGMVIWAQDYGRGSRLMPTVVGSLTAVLCVLDLLSRLDNGLGAALRLALGADFRNREMSHDPALRAELGMIGWMVGFIVVMLGIGILPTVPLFIAAYMRLQGKRSWTSAILSALLVFGFVLLVFEILLGTTLYRGVLFDPKGFGAW
ncbi:MAG: tripartite tricarboxylate transporter TctB family protein [Rhodobacter sp.]|nr:tripartite tricarboxylate transporter TctB family protein [Rhodobacter sp.]